METIDYVSENPFRLLGIGSGTLQAEVNRMASIAESDLRLGLLNASGSRVVNVDTLPLCVAAVGRMDREPVLRTVYRLFWPFASPASVSHDSGADEEWELWEAALSDAPEFYRTQIRFLRQWMQFRAVPSPASAAQAFAWYRQLGADSQATGYLTDLLQQEGLEFGQAAEVLSLAKAQGADALLDAASRAAMQSWSAEAVSEALEYITALVQSGLPEAAIQRAIEALAPIGRDEEAKLLATTNASLEWLIQGRAMVMPGMNLGRLAAAVKGRLPEAERWTATYDNCMRSLVAGARETATVIAFSANEPQKAVALLEHLLEQPLSAEAQQQVRADLAQLRENIAKGPTHGGLYKPNQKPPSLTTINSIGGKLYGRTPCPERPGWYFATYYFVILFLPLIPIRRYLVTDAPGGGWYFFASAPLTRAGRYHQTIALTLLLLLIGFGAYSAMHPQPPAAPPVSLRPYQARTAISNEQSRQLHEEHSRLVQELENIDENSITDRLAELERRKAQLLKEGDHVDRTSKAAVANYNKRIHQLNQEGDQVNKEAEEYNKKVERLKALEKQMKATP